MGTRQPQGAAAVPTMNWSVSVDSDSSRSCRKQVLLGWLRQPAVRPNLEVLLIAAVKITR